MAPLTDLNCCLLRHWLSNSLPKGWLVTASGEQNATNNAGANDQVTHSEPKKQVNSNKINIAMLFGLINNNNNRYR